MKEGGNERIKECTSEGMNEVRKEGTTPMLHVDLSMRRNWHVWAGQHRSKHGGLPQLCFTGGFMGVSTVLYGGLKHGQRLPSAGHMSFARNGEAFSLSRFWGARIGVDSLCLCSGWSGAFEGTSWHIGGHLLASFEWLKGSKEPAPRRNWCRPISRAGIA